MTSFRHCFVLVALVVSLVGAEEPVRFDGYHLIRTVPQSTEDVENLALLQEDPEIDFWLEPRAPGLPVDIFVSPEKVEEVQDYLSSIDLQSEIAFDDAQPLVAEQLEKLNTEAKEWSDWREYETLDSINGWLKKQAENYPKIATLIQAGSSYEKRPLLGLRIAHQTNLPIIFLEAGIHAREWISPATATWIIQQALNTTDELIKSYEWHIFPSVNPDGYAYTRTNRMWRKTRRRSGNCVGVDPNRNWPYQWRASKACSETYPGEKAASEPETQGLISYLKSVVNRTRIYISLHSYSQLLMYPYGYTTSKPPNDKRFRDIGTKAVAKLKARYGTRYRVGPIATTIYVAYGSTIDYAYSLNITYPYVFELRDTGRHGFLLPKDQIIPTALETFDGLSVILQEAKN